MIKFWPHDSFKSEKTYRKIPFIGSTSFKVANQLKNCDILAAFYNKSTLRNILVNNKIDKKDRLNQSGVYQINCNNCNFIYIGRTERNFNIRINEHIKAWELNNSTKSNVAKHMLTNNHTFSFNNVKILHVQPKGLKLDALEAWEIQKANSKNISLMNEQLVLSNSPLLNPF